MVKELQTKVTEHQTTAKEQANSIQQGVAELTNGVEQLQESVKGIEEGQELQDVYFDLHTEKLNNITMAMSKLLITSKE